MQHAEAVIATCPRTGVEESLEAMAAGKPVVGWKTADLAEIVADKATGVLVPAGDRGALAACTGPFSITRSTPDDSARPDEFAPPNGSARPEWSSNSPGSTRSSHYWQSLGDEPGTSRSSRTEPVRSPEPSGGLFPLAASSGTMAELQGCRRRTCGVY